MKYPNKPRYSSAMTLTEMIVSISLMAILLAVVVPQFRILRLSWDSKKGSSEAIQNGRVLADHFYQNLTTAVRVTKVSSSSELNGYIEFEDIDGNTLRYQIGADGIVEFGAVGSLSDLAGPVSRLSFSCYSVDDLDSPITDVNDIRYIKMETTLTNSSENGSDKSFIASAFIPAEAGSGDSPVLIGWWKLDETLGLTAADSSGNGNHGTLSDIPETQWTTGIIDGALEFDGSKGNVEGTGTCPTGNYTVSAWAKDSGSSSKKGTVSVIYSAKHELWLGVDREDSPSLRVDSGGTGSGAYTASGTWTRDEWHHVAATWDGSNIHLYIDGVDMPVTINGTPKNPVLQPAAIGGLSQNPNKDVWIGLIDDVRVYDQALTASEIAALAASY